MMMVLTIINTVILLILFGDKVANIIKTKVLDKTTLDEQLVAAIKEIIAKIKK